MAIADGAVSSTQTSGFDDGTVACNRVQSAFLVIGGVDAFIAL